MKILILILIIAFASAQNHPIKYINLDSTQDLSRTQLIDTFS